LFAPTKTFRKAEIRSLQRDAEINVVGRALSQCTMIALQTGRVDETLVCIAMFPLKSNVGGKRPITGDNMTNENTDWK
jgi:hypothetical protein